MSRINDSQAYNINLENEVSRLLSHFESDFVLDVVENNTNSRLRFNTIPMANLCGSFEQTFKTMLANYPASYEQIMIVRSKTYGEIIDVLCKGHNLSFRDPMNTDLYGIAYYLYGFLVSDFQKIMVNYITRLILREKESLLLAVGYDDTKKSRDVNMINGIKVEKDSKIITLSAHLPEIISIISNLPITLNDIIVNTYTDPTVIDYMSSVVYDNGNFFKDIYMTQFNDPESNTILMSNISLELHTASTIILTKENE